MRLATSVILALLLPVCVFASNSQQAPNGISVGPPKVYDNRSLTIMLETLGQTLQGMQSFVNQTNLATALANIQGTQTTESVTNATIKALPIPSLTTTIDKPTPDALDVNTVETRAAFTPTVPTIPDPSAISGFTPQFGNSAGDLLNDQINLTYQIFNVRMILERSLTDRLLDDDPRLQAVLGFNVTLDPPRTAVDAVAVVEITVSSASNEPVSVVAMMPQEKTYNAATLSTKSRQFGGTAVASAFELGVNTRRRRQTFYLYRDNDTVAYERMIPGTNDVVFGWMFRPVLGRRAVSPGLRQMLAVVALPAKDLCPANGSCANAAQKLQAKVRTYWKKYDADTLTSFERHDANRAARFKYTTTFGLTKPEIFQSRYTNEMKYENVVVKPTSEFDQNLGPEVTRVTWTPVGPKNALVAATGKNFFTGTQLILGDKRYTASDGLVLKSNNAFELVATIDALSSGPGMISGRYGRAVPFMIASAGSNAPAFTIASAKIGPSLSGMRRVEIHLKKPPFAAMSLADLPENSAPLVTINGNTMALPYDITSDRNAVIILGAIPDSFVSSGSRLIKVAWPFLSPSWTAVQLQTVPAYELSRLGAKSFLLETGEPAGFTKDPDNNDLANDQCWQLVVDGKPMKVRTSRCPRGNKQTQELTQHHVLINFTKDAPEKITLVSPDHAVFPLDVPKAAAKAATDSKSSTSAATTATAKDPTVSQFDSVFVDFPAKSAAKVTAVEANQQPLRFTAKPDDDKKVRVHVTRELTAKPGNVDITITEDGKPSTARLVITPKAEK